MTSEEESESWNSTLPPLLTPEVSRMFRLLWFAVAYYFGDPPMTAPLQTFALARNRDFISALMRMVIPSLVSTIGYHIRQAMIPPTSALGIGDDEA